LCGALGVSRGGFYAWLTRPRSERSRSDEEVGAKVRASFLSSDRTYGCGYRKSHPAVLMVQSAKDRAADDIPGPLNAVMNWASLFKDK
jgi:hypothetical protein